MTRNLPDAPVSRPAAGARPTRAIAPADAGSNRTIRYIRHSFA